MTKTMVYRMKRANKNSSLFCLQAIEFKALFRAFIVLVPFLEVKGS
jgi:hypothetical protein